MLIPDLNWAGEALLNLVAQLTAERLLQTIHYVLWGIDSSAIHL